MRINRVSAVMPRDEVTDLIQDFDAVARKLGTPEPKQRRHYFTNKQTVPFLYMTSDGKLVPASRLPVTRSRRLLKAIVVGVFVVVAAASGVLIV